MNRKEFIKSVGRVSILAGMLALVAIFYRQNRITLYSDCTDNRYCNGCKSLNNCSLPEAKKERENG
jgi:hypothetical protein